MKMKTLGGNMRTILILAMPMDDSLTLQLIDDMDL